MVPGPPARLLAGAVLALLLLAPLLTSTAAAAPLPTSASPVRVEVTRLLPRAPTRPDELVTVAGRIVNTSGETVEQLQVQLLVGGVLRSRSALALADDGLRPARPRGEPEEPARPELAPRSQAAFELQLPVSDLRLGSLGVYPLQVQVTGRLAGTRRAVELARVQTFLPWFGGDEPAASRIAVLWPLVGEPARTPDGAFVGADLAADVGERDGEPGRLSALLRAALEGSAGGCDEGGGAAPLAAGTAPDGSSACRGEPVPVTVAADPALLAAVEALGEPHVVVGPDGRRDAGPDASARRWLQDLRRLLEGTPSDGAAGGDRDAPPAADLLALPYADPDVVALTRQPVGLAGDVGQLRLLGRRTAADVTGAEPLEQVVWPPGGPVPSTALDASLGGGATAVVLDEQALRPAGPSSGRTPGTRTELTTAAIGPVTGLVLEPTLSELLAVGPDDQDWQGERLAEQRWLVETAMLAAERPGESRTFVVAPPRRGTVVAGVGAEVLRDIGRLPWLCPVRLADVVAGRERCAPGVVDRPPTDTTEDRGGLAAVGAAVAPVDDALPAAYLRELARVRALGSQLTDEVLVAGSDAAAEVTQRFLQARGRAESSAWRDDPEGGLRLLELYEDDVASYRRSIEIRTPGRQLLTADSGVIEITVTNALDQPVTVGVQLNDPVEARLTSTDTDVRTVGPQEVVVVRLRAQARTSGQFVVRATLLDRSGQPFGEPAELVVTSTRFGRLALAVTGIGAGVLLVAAGVRIARRALRRTQPMPPPHGDAADG